MEKRNELGYTFNQVWTHIAKELERNRKKLHIIHPKQQYHGKFSAIRSEQ